MATVFAYGQTSSGKTFTMMGITEYAIVDIYDYIEKHNDTEFLLKFSAMEIYNDSVRDLLSTDSTPHRNLDDPERGTFIEKLTEEPLKNWNHVMELLSICEDCTLTAAVNFVDLAGNERASQSLSAGTRLKEGCHINRILLTLGTIIRKLSKGRNGHVPLRDSKLTHILQSSLGDNARTAIICTMNPPRKVTTNAQVNVVISDAALIKHLQRELARLESELRSQGPTFVASHYSALLREKGLQIEKAGEEDDRFGCSTRLGSISGSGFATNEGHSMTRVLITSHACKFGRHQNFRSVNRSLYSYGHSGRSSDDHYIQILPEFEENFVPNDTSPQLLVGASMFIRSNFGWSWDMIEEKTNGTSEDLCKEVRCIEAEESNRSSSPEQNTEISKLIKVEHNDNEHTPPNGFKNEFTGRPEDIRRRLYELNYGANIKRLSRKGARNSKGSKRKLLNFWDVCNVSLVHRTNVFLLFKGDPTDSIYMEVDLRRLSFLKDTLSQGSKTVEEGQTLLPTSRRLIHGDVSGFVSGASESCDMDTAFACSHLHLH
ncbi:unnamed protein product [Camellia sinensis]